VIDINEELFTDYAIGLSSAYIQGDIKAFHNLLESYYKKEMKNQTFMPGLIIGMIFHIGSLINHISDCSDETPEKVFKEYALSYSLSREKLMNSDMLSPKKAQEYLENLIANGENL